MTDPMTETYEAPPPAASPPPTGPPPPPPPHSAWRPPQAEHGRNASLVFGFILVAIGVWFFATRTLGLDLPELRWDQIWPIFLIGLGVWVVLGSFNRRT